MVKINLNNFRNSDGKMFIPRPKVYFDGYCYEYNEKSIDEKLEILSELVVNGLDLVSEIEKYMEARSPVTVSSLKDTLSVYILYLEGKDAYLTELYRLDHLSEIKLAAMLQTALKAHYDDIRFGNRFNNL